MNPPSQTNWQPMPAPEAPPVKPMPASNTLILLLVLLVLMLTGTTGYEFYQNIMLQRKVNLMQSTSPIPQGSPSTDTTSNWKTYTNTQANFSFKYPNEIFVYQGNPQPDSQYWSNKVNGGAPLELGQEGVWLNVTFSNPGPAMISFYKRIISLKTNGEITESAITKLGDLSSDGVIGATYHQGVPKNAATEAAYTYEAVWVKGDFVYRLDLSAFTEENLQKNKVMFDNIVSTFNLTK